MRHCGEHLGSGMELPVVDAHDIVEKYLHERKEEMEERHDAFGIEPRLSKQSKSKSQPWEKSRYAA